MIPTKTRNHSATFIQHEKEGILVDCGEGTQRQFRLASISPSKVTKLLISHWHGDHVLGIPGLLQNLKANNYKKTLEIYGPKGSKTRLKHMLEGIEMAGNSGGPWGGGGGNGRDSGSGERGSIRVSFDCVHFHLLNCGPEDPVISHAH